MKTLPLFAPLQRALRLCRPSTRPSSRPRRLVWALALAGVATHTLAPWAGPAHAASALPTGLNVVQGQATLKQAGNQLTINNSAGAVLNWQSFNIGAANAVRFEQPTAASKVLNRVVGNNPSQIFGKLSSNGEVWLVNPHGVLFGRDARVDVGSLVVSTLNIGNDDWRAGRFSLTGGAGAAAAIVNQGELLTTTGGRVLLLAGAGGVRNEGLITAPDGQVALAAGASVDLVDGQTRHLAVRVQAPQGEVLNLGRLSANGSGGRVDLMAAMVNQQGFVRAESLAGSGGQVVLEGSQGVNLAAGSVTSTAGASGGQVRVDAVDGTTMLAGEVNVTGSSGTGGDALLLGQQVGLLDGGLIDASGATGGGRVRVGGGLQGKDQSVVNAQAVYMGPGMQIRADATQFGQGGNIILWSDKATRAYGTLSARGGALGGDGGFIETSGGWLDAQPAAVRTDATLGRAGLWLLDPNNIRIDSQFPNTNVGASPNFTSTGDSAIVNVASIVAALNAGNNVTITTGTGGTNLQAGDITMSNVFLSAAPAQPVSLTITAARHIRFFDSTIRTTDAAMGVTLSAANGQSGVGEISLSGVDILTRGGNINLGGGTQAVGPNITSPRAGAVGLRTSEIPSVGVTVEGSTLDAGAGNISITGLAAGIGDGSVGVLLAQRFFFNGEFEEILPTALRGRDIDIYGWVDSNNAEERIGVLMGGGVTVRATHGLSLTGIANSTVFRQNQFQQQWQPVGVYVPGGTLSVQPAAIDNTAYLTIDGTVRDGAPVGAPALRLGVWVDNAAARLEAFNGTRVSLIGRDLMDAEGASAAMLLGNNAVFAFGSAGPVLLEGNTRVLLNRVVIGAPLNAAVSANAGNLLSLQSASITGNPSAVALSARDISLDGSRISFVGNLGNDVPAAVSLTASRDIELLSSRIDGINQPLSISLTAAAANSGSGTVSLDLAFLFSNGGNITIGGGSTAVGPNITAPRAGAVAASGGASASGVTLIDSTVDAGEGALRISGQSIANDADAYGVRIIGSGKGNSSLRGDTIDVFGWVDANAAFKRTGVFLERFSGIFGTSSVNITGLANSTVFHAGNVAPIGVEISGSVYAWNAFQGGPPVAQELLRGQAQGGLPQGEPPALTILGTTNDGARTDNSPTRYGVLINDTAEVILGFGFDRGRGVINGLPPGAGRTASISGLDLSANNEVAVRMVSENANFELTSSLSIQGNRRVELGGDINAPSQGSLEARSGTTLSLLDVQVGGAPTAVTLRGDSLLLASGNVIFEAPTAILLQAPEVRLGAGGTFDAVSFSPIRVLTNRLVTDQPSTLLSEAAGTAIAIAGYDGVSNITSMQSTNLPVSLQTANGRWLIYAVDDSIPDAGLNFAFRQYGTTYPVEPIVGVGNGLVYALAPVLTLSSATAITKAYDGTNTVTTAGVNFNLTGQRPGQSFEFGGGGLTLAYPGTAVGNAQLLTVGGYVQPQISDANERPVYGYTTQFDVRGDITRRQITLGGVTAANKTYDGSRAASLAGGALANLVAGETLTIALANGQFDTANAGNGKAVTGTVTLSDGSGLLSNYELVGGGAVAATASITPRGVSVVGLQAASKVYDGTLGVNITGGSLNGLVEDEGLGLAFANSQLASAGVGNNKAVNTTVTLQNGSGLASNYTLLLPDGPYASNAAVTPAALLYVANPASFVVGQLGALTGSVTGFVAGETQAGATTGNLVFTASVPNGAGAGTYAVAGSGLAAANYSFAQAPANATALTLTPAPVTFVPEPAGLPELDDTQRTFRQALPPLPRGPEGTRALDALQSLRVDPSWLSMSFGELDLSALSREEIAALLEARRQYKMLVLGVGRERLTQDPSLADVPACQTARQAADGRCLVTAELLAAIDERGEAATIAAAPLPALPAAVAPIQALPPSLPLATAPAAPVVAAVAFPQPVAPAPAPAAASPAPAATIAVVPAVAAPEARVPPRVRVAAQPTTVAPALPAARPVRSASIPQIQRKIAVLVGIDNYVDERIPALENARRDADAVARILENRLGYETIVVRDAGREAMVGVLNKLALQTRPTDSVVVYFAGHGTVIDGTGQGYWIPATADAEKPETWLSNRDIARLLGGIRASQVVLISDSCFSGSLVGDKRLQATNATDAQAILRRRSTLVMSSGGDEPVADGARNGHSPFANSLMGNLQGLDNWRAGGNVFERVLTEVTQRLPQTPRYGPARDSRYVEGGDYLFEQRQLGVR